MDVRAAGGARAAAFFDLDKTVIARSSALAFSGPLQRGGLLSRRDAVRAAYAQLVFTAGSADHEHMERLRARLSAVLRGWDVEAVRGIVAETLRTVVDPMVHEEAVRLIEAHHAAGDDVVIVSSSGEEVAAPIGALVGADRTIATRMVVADGAYTGEIEEYVYGEAKAAAVRRLAAEEGYDLAASSAYSDSVTDLPMLEAVGHPHAVNPGRVLRRTAVERGWPVLEFRQPVALHPWRRRAAGDAGRDAALVGAVAAVGAATGALVWYAGRRHDRG